MNLYNSRAQAIQLNKEIGSGGEGKVYSIIGNDAIVAKTYHKAPDRMKCEKLLAMVEVQNEKLANIASWPIDVLYDKPNSHIIGILMPKIIGFKEIHELYSPKTRMSEFTNVGWDFLVYTAINLSKAFDTIHENGHVIGDVNHANMIVSSRAIVKLIDCDSFQINHLSRKYLCEVGVSTHQPPEFQDLKSFSGVVRNSNHDCFGLAVLIFQLLFMGRHPFSGKYLGKGEMTIEKAIREYRFAYGVNATTRQMQSPPGTLALEAVSKPVAELFEHAFTTKSRPSAREWVFGLQGLYNTLKQCKYNAAHKYLNTLSECPWCDIENKAGVSLFAYIVTANYDTGTFSIELIQTQIEAIRSPKSHPTIPDESAINVNPLDEYISYGKRKRVGKLISYLGFCLAFIVHIASQSELSIGIAVASFVIRIIASFSVSSDIKRKARNDLEDANRKLINLKDKWQKEASENIFINKKNELKKSIDRYKELPTIRAKNIQEAQQNRRKYQLEKYLDKYRIYDAKIDGIGPTRKAALQSYGIETAADIEYSKIIVISGFGPTYTGNLVRWKQNIEGKFKFNANQAVDPKVISDIEKRITDERIKIERLLINGISELKVCSSNIESKRNTLLKQLEGASKEYAQAKANLDAL